MNFFVNCPDCGKKMEPGWVYGSGAVFWSPKPDKVWKVKGREDIMLSSCTEYPVGHICKDCRKIILKY